jgi:hypothetical protein
MNKQFLFLATIVLALTNDCKSQVVQGYPFGCSILITHKFPEHWEASDEANDTIKKPHEADFFHTSAWYERMAWIKPLPVPPIEKTEIIKIGESTACSCTNVLAADSCRYRLSNIGMYQCYYVSDDVYGNPAFEKSCPDNSCLVYGNLVLYDPSTRTAKTILIYYEGGSGTGTNGTPYRYFYITKEKIIELYEGSCNDAGCDMQNKYSIRVLENGEIEIKENKNRE